MDRLAKLRIRPSIGLNESSISSTSIGAGTGYETANDESLASMYFSADETEDLNQIEEPTLFGADVDVLGVVKEVANGDKSVQDHTLENDFSVEEVSTIRKATIAQASPATVKVASGMAVKYLGVASTPAAKRTSPRNNLSGIVPLEKDQPHSADRRKSMSILKKIRDPKTSECSSGGEDAEESKFHLDSSVALPAAAVDNNNKSFGTNVLSNFFASLDVKGTPGAAVGPVPEIRVIDTDQKTPPNKRDSRRLEKFFESLKKDPAQPEEEEKENKKSVRKSLIPTRAATASADRIKPKTSLLGSAGKPGNRVASPIVKPPRKSSLVKLIPDQLKEMRKANLVSIKPPGTKVIPAPRGVKPTKEDIVGDSVQVNGLRKSIAVPSISRATIHEKSSTAQAAAAAKRKSVVPASIASRRSVLPAKTVRRTIMPPSATLANKSPSQATASNLAVKRTSVLAPPGKVGLKIPAKTTVSSSDLATRRSSLGKRPLSSIHPTERAEPLAKLRKSLAPVKETQNPPPKPVMPSRIRPPSTITSAAGFKKPETFSCGHCQRIFRLKSSYDTHLKTVHQSATSTSSASSGHNKSAETGTEFKCQYCAKAFAGAKFLANHVETNCVKIPPLEKRKLLAQGEQQRAALIAAAKRTPEAPSRTLRPTSATSSSSIISNNSTNSVRSGDDGAASDTSTSSNPADKNRKAPTTAGAAGRKRISTTVGHGGISRTPKKEIKCHLCARRFLNAVEYALHVQAHAKGGPDRNKKEEEQEKPQGDAEKDEAGKEAAAEIVQKLATMRSRMHK